MENLPTLRQMQYLLALAERKNFQKAAEDCHVTQSTLSGGIKDMEDILRSPVIDRSSRSPVKFTPLGEDIVHQARNVIVAMEDITYRARAQNESLSWPIKMGIIPTIAPYMLPRLLKPLQKALPKLDLHIYELRSPQIVERLQDGSLDFALMAFPFDLKGLHHKTVTREKFFLAAPPSHLKNKKSVSMKDIASEKLLLLEDGHCLRDHALDACKLPVTELKTINAASLATLIQMVHQGYGVTLLPEMAANDSSLPRNLDLCPINGAASRDIGFAWKKGGAREKDIQLVTKTLEPLLKSSSSRTAKT
ncbi:MAG: LysR family transcriptional regulator [Micavibrio aeruginosavorus]|uniref:LysR family transcriptional regulator n=1 Tax=Micavibrio aeruginosavorus TaxID=349221 RepID=A0A2W5PYW9_9BACT|nr:MAG: LysR family transcriptional regulator [Micavibrio aeruginosavorus]